MRVSGVVSVARVRRVAAAHLAALVLSLVVASAPGCRAASSTLAPSQATLTAVATTSPAATDAVPATSGTSPSAVPSLATTVPPPGEGAYLGVFREPAPFVMSALDDYTRESGKPPAIVMWYQAWGPTGQSSFRPKMVAAVLARGSVPLISWEPWDPGYQAHQLQQPWNQPAYRLQSIIDGRYDEYIRGWARGVKAVRGPVMIRFMHEMNGNWYPWGDVMGQTPETYRAAWRHVHDIFAAEGATNVTWVWTVNREKPDKKPPLEAYYPGDAYVDWVGVSGFNWGKSRVGYGWASFEAVQGPTLRRLAKLGKPVMVAETGCAEQGGDKAAWLTEMYAGIRRDLPAVKAVVYFDKREDRPEAVVDWRIGSSPAALQAFRRAIAPAYYVSAPSPKLASWFEAARSE